MSYDNSDIAGVEIARHLTLGEITCHCCGRGAMNVALLTAWGRLRAVYGKQIVIMSAFRCPKHNAEIGGAAGSWHMAGMALDIAAIDPWWFTDDALAAMIDSGFRGIGRNRAQTYIHIDCRSTPYFWLYEGDTRHVDVAATQVWRHRRLIHDA